MEEWGESIGLRVVRRSREGLMGEILVLVGGFGRDGRNDGVSVGRKEGGSGRRKVKGGGLVLNEDRRGLGIVRDVVGEGNVVISEVEEDVEFVVVGILKG